LNRPATLANPGSPSTRHRALPALLLGGAAIGCSPIFVRISEVGPIATAFWRLTLALLPLSILYSRERFAPRPHPHPQRGRDYLLVSAPGVFLAADLATWHLSLHMTTVANSTLLVNLAPIFVTLFSWSVLGQRISGTFLLGLAVAIGGVLVLKGGAAALQTGGLAGDGMAVLAAAFYAGYILLLGRARRLYSTTTIMLWSTVSAALCTGLLAGMVERALMPWTPPGWLTLIGLAWVSQAAGQSLITFALAWLPATLSSLTLLIQPVVASILAWLLLNEPLTAGQIAGGFIIIGGIALARRG
jgi:drug/metabolite transporter (DMT)-like permease